jgi:hypothetical protein
MKWCSESPTHYEEVRTRLVSATRLIVECKRTNETREVWSNRDTTISNVPRAVTQKTAIRSRRNTNESLARELGELPAPVALLIKGRMSPVGARTSSSAI